MAPKRQVHEVHDIPVDCVVQHIAESPDDHEPPGKTAFFAEPEVADETTNQQNSNNKKHRRMVAE